MFATVPSPQAESVSEAQPLSRDQLIERHLPLVTYTVNRMAEFLGSGVMDREDAIGYGSKGLIAAVDNFDASKGTSFASYAIMRIRGAIIDAAREMDILPRSQRRRMREVEGANMELANQLGRWPTVKELAMKTGLSIEEVKALQDQRGARVQSLEQSVTSRDESYEWEIEDDDASVQPETVVDRKVVAVLLARAMTTLKDRDREIINLRYNQDMPFRLIGLKLHISESRVSQIHLRILNNLKKALEHTDIAAA